MNQESNFSEKVRALAAADPAYAQDAYLFVAAAVNYTVGKLKARRHVSGQELLAGTMEFAEKEFGAVAEQVLKEWGIFCASDVGEVVYKMIGAGLLNASPQDKQEDFDVPFDWFPPPRKRPQPDVPKMDL